MVTKSFFRARGIVNVDIEFERGCVTGILGPNASGKTTLIKSIIGEHKLDQGDIQYLNKDFTEDQDVNVAYMPSESFFPSYNLYTIIDIHDETIADFSKEKMNELMKIFKLSGFLRFRNMSKGQQKAFHFSLTMARDCDYYIFDEPFSGIDPVYRKQIIDEILNHINTEDKVIIISSHELNEIDSILDKCVLLKKGKVEGVYDIDEIQAENNLYDWYIEKYST
jgi:ABC-2 type transport system ATP-binding protein